MKSIYIFLKRITNKIRKKANKKVFRNISSTSTVGNNVIVTSADFLFMEENTNISNDSIIMNGERGAFYMKKNSGAAVGLLAICGNHMNIIGLFHKEINDSIKRELDVNGDYSKPIIVNEDVWIGARVTLTQGVNVGRGAVIGAGSVVRSNVPPYAIVAGNPAKVIGFKFTPEQILEHERKLYAESERLSEDLLKKNYKKYFLDKIKEIRMFTNISF